MHPIILKTGFFTIYSYGFMLSLAFLACIFVSLYLAKGEGIEADKVLETAFWVIVSSIIGARLMYVALFWQEFSGDPLSIVMIQNGGLVFYGGFILGALALVWQSRVQKIPVLKLLDLAAPGTALGYSIGRIGCFLNGCCYGVEANIPWAVTFPQYQGARHPTQIYAFLTMFIAFIVLMLLWQKRRYGGQIFLEAVFLYSLYRFTVEFFRVGERVFIGLTFSQILSVILFIAAGGFLYWKTKTLKRS